MSPARLPAARREELKAEAYRLSLEDGLSYRQIAARLGIDPKTVSSLIREAASQARESIDLTYQRTYRARTRLLADLEEQLKAKGVSPHARAQLAHAFNATLDSLDLLAGTRAPSKSSMAVRGRVDVRHEYAALEAAIENLTYGETWAMKRLMDKACAEPEEAQEMDVLSEIVEEYQRGTLSEAANPYLHALPEPADIVED